MSAWPGKFVIGLTGNIATGKSVVRRMLEHAGAFGIDADALANRAIQPDAPGYQPVLDAFGRYILNESGEIDRAKLAQLVFSDEQALALLESIVHPLVREAVDLLARKSRRSIIVIEAIKLLESPLCEACDAIWVTTASKERRLARLVEQRGMNHADAERRMAAQSPQREKVALADTVIHNDASIENTWDQVRAAWELLFPDWQGDGVFAQREDAAQAELGDASLSVERAGPSQAEMIAEFMAAQDAGSEMDAGQVMDAFGEKAYLLLKADGQLRGLLGWKVENLVARVDDVYLMPELLQEGTLQLLMKEVEDASRELQCEIALLFLPPPLARQTDLWAKLEYQVRAPQSLGVLAWQEAALESYREGSTMLFKQLRSDRVLKPI